MRRRSDLLIVLLGILLCAAAVYVGLGAQPSSPWATPDAPACDR